MARQIRTLPMASAPGKPRFKPTRAAWRRIERAYGHNIPRATRDEILTLTRSFVYFAPLEHAAQPLKRARKMLGDWKKAAANFQRMLHNSGDAGVWARSRVNAHFDDVRFRRRQFFDDFSGVLTSFIVACSQAIADAEDPSLRGYRKGEGWENWVRGLRRALNKKGLPTAVRKDSADLGRDSPFTKLVEALQKLMPTSIRRGRASTDALAKTIQGALRRDK
jgi:hypothetical protein